LYLVARRYIEVIRVIDGEEAWDAPWTLLPIPLDRARPQHILLFGPSDRYGVWRALAIFMPCLGD
jgi:hypothetical protein